MQKKLKYKYPPHTPISDVRKKRSGCRTYVCRMSDLKKHSRIFICRRHHHFIWNVYLWLCPLAVTHELAVFPSIGSVFHNKASQWYTWIHSNELEFVRFHVSSLIKPLLGFICVNNFIYALKLLALNVEISIK